MSSRAPARVSLALRLKKFYLDTAIDSPEYVLIKIADITQEFVDEYNLHKFAKDGWTYLEITKGAYGLPQAGILANKQLIGKLGEAGYF